MKIENVSPEEWLAKAERYRFDLLRCIYWIHEYREWNDLRLMENHLLIFVEQGSIMAELDGKSLKLNAGDSLWIPPGVLRRIRAEVGNKPERDYRLHFRTGKGRKEICFSDTSRVLRNAWSLLPFFRSLNMSWRSPRRYGKFFIQGTCLALASEFLSLLEGGTRSEFTERELGRLSTYIAENMARSISPGELASVAGLSRDYFSRKFGKCRGISPREFIKREKINLIANFLLESDLSVKETACRFGYEDVSFFCRQFREVMKCSPAMYRKAASDR